MLEATATLFYTQLHDLHKSLQERFKSKNPCHLGGKLRQKDAKITLCEAACLAMLFQWSGQKHFKRFIELNKEQLLRLFPTLPSYSRLVIWLPKTEHLLLNLAEAQRKEPDPSAPKAHLQQYAVDSTKIDPHKAGNWPKCMRRQAAAGHAHEGVFFGFKLHVLCDMQGRVARCDFTPANFADISVVQSGFIDGVKGICFADSGYVDAPFAFQLRQQGLAFIAKPKKNQIDELWLFNKVWAKAYRMRQIVEGVFSYLKRFCGLPCKSIRRVSALRSLVWASLSIYGLLRFPASASAMPETI